MNIPDYYDALGLKPDADADQIKSAYRALARTWHPDVHKEEGKQEAEERFKKISEAYEVLSDKDKRAKYDAIRTGGGGQPQWESGPSQHDPFGGGVGSGGGGGFSDFFASIFGDEFRRASGRRTHRRYSMRGADVRAELKVPLTTLVDGAEHTFAILAQTTCPDCGGTGTVEGEHICPTCAGIGQVRRNRDVTLRIPPGTRNGQTLRLRGLGEPGDGGGEAGDLYVTVRVVDSEPFRVNGDDIEADLPIAPW